MKNSEIELKLRELELRRKKLLLENPRLYWARYYHQNTRGQPLRFDNVPFLISFYKALHRHRHIIAQKSVQCGISEALIVSHLYEAACGLSVLYVLPKRDLRNTFVQNRINRPMARIDYYRNLLAVGSTGGGKKDSVILKMFGKGVIKYVDSNSSDNFVEYPADALYLDEKDEMDQDNIKLAPQRLSSSEHRLIREVANPTVENYGIDVDWRKSSQHMWHVKCPHCNEWQTYDWFINVVREIGTSQYEVRHSSGEPVCKKCERILERFIPGEFVPARPSASIIGFRINKIFGSFFTTMHELLHDDQNGFFAALNNDSSMQVFFNTSLGMPYTAKGSKLTLDLLDSVRDERLTMRTTYSGSAPAVLGADVGKVIHVVIRAVSGSGADKRYPLLWAGTVRNETDLQKLCQDFSVKCAVIDALPEENMVAKAKGLVNCLYSCFYGDDKYSKVDQRHRVVNVNRTFQIDEVVSRINKKQLLNFANMQDVPEYYDHMQNQTRFFDAASGRYRWLKLGPDHFLHADTYCSVASDLLTNKDIFLFYEQYLSEEEREGEPVKKGKSVVEIFRELERNRTVK